MPKLVVKLQYIFLLFSLLFFTLAFSHGGQFGTAAAEGVDWLVCTTFFFFNSSGYYRFWPCKGHDFNLHRKEKQVSIICKTTQCYCQTPADYIHRNQTSPYILHKVRCIRLTCINPCTGNQTQQIAEIICNLTTYLFMSN